MRGSNRVNFWGCQGREKFRRFFDNCNAYVNLVYEVSTYNSLSSSLGDFQELSSPQCTSSIVVHIELSHLVLEFF